jgi:hypothetical protein
MSPRRGHIAAYCKAGLYYQYLLAFYPQSSWCMIGKGLMVCKVEVLEGQAEACPCQNEEPCLRVFSY